MLRSAVPLLTAMSFLAPQATGGSDPAATLSPKTPRPPAIARRADFHHAMDRARAWFDGLKVDTVQLTKNGVKGKKKLGEILTAYWNLHRFTKDPAERARIKHRVTSLVAQTSRAEYHNMLTCPDLEFKQNSMSYMRVLKLMEQFGFDTSAYRRELRKAKPRFDDHMAGRGAWQRSMFAAYYDLFGLERPPILLEALDARGVVARRVPLPQYSLVTAYHLTHQVFVAFDYGDRRSQSRFDDEDLEYLRGVLPALASVHLEREDPDILAEVLSSMTYLGFTAEAVYDTGIGYLLDSQNPDGTWGDYPRDRHGESVDLKLYLHTTLVAAQALLTAFEDGP